MVFRIQQVRIASWVVILTCSEVFLRWRSRCRPSLVGIFLFCRWTSAWRHTSRNSNPPHHWSLRTRTASFWAFLPPVPISAKIPSRPSKPVSVFWRGNRGRTRNWLLNRRFWGGLWRGRFLRGRWWRRGWLFGATRYRRRRLVWRFWRRLACWRGGICGFLRWKGNSLLLVLRQTIKLTDKTFKYI